MTKCDFCTMSHPNGECFWHSRIAAQDDCEKAIKRMIEALQGEEKNKKKKRWG